mgnify:CR=1 FL=1
MQAASFQPFWLLCPRMDQEYRVCYYPLTVSSNSMDPGLRRVLIFPCCSKTFLSPRPPKGLLMHKKKLEILHRFHSCRYAGFSFPFSGIAFFCFMKLPVFSDIFLSLLSCIVFAFFPAKGQFFLFISVFLILLTFISHTRLSSFRSLLAVQIKSPVLLLQIQPKSLQ